MLKTIQALRIPKEESSKIQSPWLPKWHSSCPQRPLCHSLWVAAGSRRKGLTWYFVSVWKLFQDRHNLPTHLLNDCTVPRWTSRISFGQHWVSLFLCLQDWHGHWVNAGWWSHKQWGFVAKALGMTNVEVGLPLVVGVCPLPHCCLCIWSSKFCVQSAMKPNDSKGFHHWHHCCMHRLLPRLNSNSLPSASSKLRTKGMNPETSRSSWLIAVYCSHWPNHCQWKSPARCHSEECLDTHGRYRCIFQSISTKLRYHHGMQGMPLSAWGRPCSFHWVLSCMLKDVWSRADNAASRLPSTSKSQHKFEKPWIFPQSALLWCPPCRCRCDQGSFYSAFSHSFQAVNKVASHVCGGSAKSTFHLAARHEPFSKTWSHHQAFRCTAWKCHRTCAALLKTFPSQNFCGQRSKDRQHESSQHMNCLLISTHKDTVHAPPGPSVLSETSLLLCTIVNCHLSDLGALFQVQSFCYCRMRQLREPK